MDSRVTPLEKIYLWIKQKESFVLQGGAGSGKTETLKETLQYISRTYPNKKIACITHTNLAVNEINERVREVDYNISTIHSFLHSLIKDYKKNIHQVIFELFSVNSITSLNIDSYMNEKEYKKEEYENYKKIYEKYSSQLYKIHKRFAPKIVSKKKYFENTEYNKELNEKIEKLNSIILEKIKKKNFNQIEYNNTSFDNFKNLTYGHDGLLKIAFLLFDKYPKLERIIKGKYDFIFIDEYQDTDERIIDFFIKSTKIGLFGDSMQSIYNKGIGDVQKYIETKQLKEIIKEDNYRCSTQVIEFINRLRNDNLVQKVALKDGEITNDREGRVNFYYYIIDKDEKKDKEKYIKLLNKLINKIDKNNNFKKLMLTNKSISSKVGFKNLYDIFDKRYTDTVDNLKKILIKLQFKELYDFYSTYKSGQYNFILTQLKRNKMPIISLDDKQKIINNIEKIVDTQFNAIETLERAFHDRLINKNEEYDFYIQKKNDFLEKITKDKEYEEFKKSYLEGKNTLARMKKDSIDIDKEKFVELEKILKKDRFYSDFFSDKIIFQEIINYFEYQNDETEYITMHKTKGSGIENVLVVVDECFWKQEYDFSTLFKKDTDAEKQLKNQKLFYVACSRTKKNLNCLQLIQKDDEKDFLNFFSNAINMTIWKII